MRPLNKLFRLATQCAGAASTSCTGGVNKLRIKDSHRSASTCLSYCRVILKLGRAFGTVYERDRHAVRFSDFSAFDWVESTFCTISVRQN